MHHNLFQAIDNSRCKTCKNHNMKIVARGMCKKCYDHWYKTNKNNPDIKFKQQKKRTPRKPPVDNKPYPIPHIITVWECSDGREFSSETEALRYEIDLFRGVRS